MSGSRVSKADLIRLARALGDEAADELDGESMGCIFERCMQRAQELNAPASVYPVEADMWHPIVRDWSRRVIDSAVEHVESCRMGDNEAERFAAGWVDQSVRRHAAIDPATCSHTMRAGRCIRCGQRPPDGTGPSVDEVIDLMHREPLKPLALVEDRSPEQLEADGDEPYRCTACGKRQCDGTHVGCPSYLLDHLRPAAHVERVRALLEEEPGRADRRANAEQWAKTRGAKGASLSG